MRHLSTGFTMMNCGCAGCGPELSRRKFLCTTAAGLAAAPLLAASTGAFAQQPLSPAPGRPILIKNGTVLTLDRAIGDFERCDVLIRGSKIAEVRPNIEAADAEIIDASNSIVSPGFIDTHRHMWQGILRNIIPDASLAEYFQVIQRTIGWKYTPDDVYAGVYVSALGAIEAGVTTVLDWSHIQNSPQHTDANIKALQDAGVRGVFGYGNPQTESPRFWEDSKHKFPDDIKRIRQQYFASDDQLLTLCLSSPSGPLDQVLKSWAAARDVGARISIHAGVGEGGKNKLLEQLNDAKALRNDTTYIHCCTLNDTEWKLIADTGGTVSIAGYVEEMMGHGTPPVQKAIEMGIRPSLSVDVETSVPGDLFTQMRTALSLQRNAIWSRGLAGEKNLPAFLKTRDVLEFATVEGARANGLERKVGTLTPGKDADILLLRTDRLNVMPWNNAVGAVVTSMDTSNVDTVLIAGKVRKRGGQMVGVDMARVTKLVNEARDRAIAASGYKGARI